MSAGRRLFITGQVALLVLGTAWASFERPAPLVNILWRDGLPAHTRHQHELALHLQPDQSVDNNSWRYVLLSPKTDTISAILSNPDVKDTFRIDLSRRTVSADAPNSPLKVWWFGPFEGARGPIEFRIVFLLVAIATLACGWRLGESRRAHAAWERDIRRR